MFYYNINYVKIFQIFHIGIQINIKTLHFLLQFEELFSLFIPKTRKNDELNFFIFSVYKIIK